MGEQFKDNWRRLRGINVPAVEPKDIMRVKDVAELTSLVTITVVASGNIVASGLIVSGTSELGTVISGVWNGDIISEQYGGTGRGSYNPGDILYSSATGTLSVLASGAEGEFLGITEGSLGWTSTVIRSMASGIGPIYTIGSEYYHPVSTGINTVNLPASPKFGQIHVIKDMRGRANGDNITISGNGNTIDGLSQIYLINDWESTTIIFGPEEWNVI